ncbi:MAG: PriCT-2 domain-containing protein [Thiotrichales bacterium]|nr:PriCT-2 domain-containing protein [Thiotrichales bacterium]
MLFDVALGRDVKSSSLTNKALDWRSIVKLLGAHTVGEKERAKWFIGGKFDGDNRSSNIISRSLMTLDIDNYNGSKDDLIFDLELALGAFNFVAYSTFSSTEDAPRARVVIPLSNDIAPNRYTELCAAFTSRVLRGFDFDKSGFNPKQIMFYPTKADASDNGVFILVGDNNASINISDYISGELSQVDVAPVVDDLEVLIANQPLDIDNDKIEATLRTYPAAALNYQEWLDVGMALHHQFQGSDEGFNYFNEWSKVDKDRYDERATLVKWRSFKPSKTNPLRFASIIKRANVVIETNADIAVDVFSELSQEAEKIKTHEEYAEFKRKVLGATVTQLPKDYRAMLAAVIAGSEFGVKNKLTKADIKTALMPVKGKNNAVIDESLPTWLRDWVYVEKSDEFCCYTKRDYFIKKSAFCAKYDRMSDCKAAEVNAVTFATVIAPVPTVYDQMFFPSAGVFFEWEHKSYVNSYFGNFMQPAEEYTEAGLATIEKFKKHLALTLEDENERSILLDWMSHVLRYEGKRVNWAILMQGGVGVGKSYFATIMQRILGSNCGYVDSTAIGGQFTGWAQGKVLNIIEEIKISGHNRYEVFDKLKPIITNDTIAIEQKGIDHKTVPNFTSYMMFTNHKDALPIDDDDRRYCIMFAKLQTKEELHDYFGGEKEAEAYFTDLFDSTYDHIREIYKWLLEREISPTFNHKGRAPDTAARREMIAIVSSDSEMDELDDIIDKHHCAVINDSLIDVTYANALIKAEAEIGAKTKLVARRLMQKGFVPIDGKKIKVKGVHHYIWLKPKKITSSEAKAAVNAFHRVHDDDDELAF